MPWLLPAFLLTYRVRRVVLWQGTSALHGMKFVVWPTWVATAVLCEALQRQLEFITQARLLSSLALSFVQGFPYAFCSITTASQGLILLPFPCASEEDQVLTLPCDGGISPQVLL